MENDSDQIYHLDEINLFDEGNEEKLIVAAKRLLEIKSSMQEEAKREPEKAPSPLKLAKAMNLSMETTLALLEFAENELGDFELSYIHSKLAGTIDENYKFHPRNEINGNNT